MLKQVFTGILLFGFFSSCPGLAEENPDELYRQGRFGEAEKAYTRSDMDNPKDIRYRYNRGCAAYQNSDFKGARAAFSSVLTRTDAKGPLSLRRNKDIPFKAAYNLGNTAFKEGNFEPAVTQYKKALLLDPESVDAKYNLELALRELEKLKKKKTEEQKEGGPKKYDKSKDKDKGSKPGENEEDSGKKQSQAQDQKNGKAQKNPEQQKAGEQRKDNMLDAGQRAEQEPPRDLSGKLTPLQATPDQGKDQPPDQTQAGAVLDKKKAEALLDNLKEDRSHFLRFQVPEDKKRGVPSGKDW